MTKFLFVFLVPIIPLCIIGLLFKDKIIVDGKTVVKKGLVAAAAGTYTSFVLLALQVWQHVSDGQDFLVRLKSQHQEWVKSITDDAQVELRCDDDEPVIGKIARKDHISVDIEFAVPSRWSGHKVQVIILPFADVTFEAFILKGRFYEADGVTSGALGDGKPCLTYAQRTISPTSSPPEQAAAFQCPSGMVPVPARTLYLGSGDNLHEARLSDVCMDKTEVTAAGYAACASRGACAKDPGHVYLTLYKDDDERRADDRLCNHAPERGNYPMSCINWQEAQDYCHSLGAGYRLPTEDEWEYAAGGPDRRKYPWGDDPPSASLLNACGSECNGAKMFGGDDGYVDSAPVGQYPNGKSYFGALDMAGNVWEWTDSWFDANQRERVDRGGGWRDDLPLSARTSHRSLDIPGLRSPRIGFRCLWSPATVTTL